jgi:pyruvate-formate lyase-activating enzyme
MNKNLKLYVQKEEYNVMAGPDWPIYEDYINGSLAEKAEIQEEINHFTAQKIKDGIIFPIRTQTACQSKWTWSTIFLNQLSTASCHRCDPVPFSLEDFDNFHNTPKKLADRKLMLEGKWPKGGCEYCQSIEETGGWSDRQHNLEIRGLTPVEIETDLTAVNVTPRLVEIFAQNTCNFACVYCSSSLSSKIEQENLKFGEFNKAGVKIPIIKTSTSVTEEYFEKFLVWLERNINQLKRLHLLGGETFIQHELMNRVLDIIDRKPNPNLQLCVFSNMNVPDKYWDLYINRIRQLQFDQKIEVFDLTASIDCWGAEQEYVRHGLNISKFEDRMAWASQQGDWLRLNVNQTVTVQTMRTMNQLVQKIDQYSVNKHIGHYFQYYTGAQMFQHPKIYGWDFWEKDAENIIAAMPRRTPAHQEAIDRMTGMLTFLQGASCYNWPEIAKLKVYLDEIDRRRGTNWRSLFSYLDINE